jgi:hypothetical protein
VGVKLQVLQGNGDGDGDKGDKQSAWSRDSQCKMATPSLNIFDNSKKKNHSLF